MDFSDPFPSSNLDYAQYIITNDTGQEALQIVIKMTKCNGRPVAKISDTPGKSMCEDEKHVEYLKKVFENK